MTDARARGAKCCDKKEQPVQTLSGTFKRSWCWFCTSTTGAKNDPTDTAYVETGQDVAGLKHEILEVPKHVMKSAIDRLVEQIKVRPVTSVGTAFALGCVIEFIPRD